jgi:hypothetical protein
LLNTTFIDRKEHARADERKNLADDPRYKTFLRKMNLPTE